MTDNGHSRNSIKILHLHLGITIAKMFAVMEVPPET